MATRLKINAMALILLCFAATPPVSAAPTTSLSYSLSGDCLSTFKLYSEYRVFPGKTDCALILKNSTSKARQVHLQLFRHKNWVDVSIFSLKATSSLKVPIDTACTKPQNNCAGIFTYRVTAVKSGNIASVTLKSISISILSMSPPVETKPSSDTSLSEFSVNGMPVADGATLNAAAGALSAVIKAVPASSGATVQVLGNSELTVGINNISIVVTAADGTSQHVFHVNVRVPDLNHDATLSTFTVNSRNTSDNQTVDLPPGTESVSVVAIPNENTSSVSIIGSNNLVAGNNNLTVEVTAQDGTTQCIYRVFLHVRDFSHDASLSSLTVNNQMAIDNQRIDLPQDTKSVSVLALPTKDTSTVAIQGSNNLNPGANTLTITVTAEDGKTKRNYSIALFVNQIDYVSKIRDFYYDFAQAPDSVVFEDNHTDPNYFDKSNPLWAIKKGLMSKYHKYLLETPILSSISETPDWRWSSGTCHPPMTASPAGHTFIVTLNITQGSDLEDPETSQENLHITIRDDGSTYIYSDLCMANFGNSVLLDRAVVEKTVQTGVLNQTGVLVAPQCPDPLYGKVGQVKQCFFKYGTQGYLVDITFQDLAGNIIWRVHQ
jgi:Cadherin-like beta sandwich domain